MSIDINLGVARAVAAAPPILGTAQGVATLPALTFYQGAVVDLGVAEAEADAPELIPFKTEPPLGAAQFSPGGFMVAQFATPGSRAWSPSLHLSIPTVFISEREDLPVRARLVTGARVAVLQADVYQVLVRVFDHSAGEPLNEVFAIELDPSDAIVDTLTVDATWDVDSEGYNFAYTIGGQEVFLRGGGRYRVEYAVELDDGNTYTLTGDVRVRPVQTYKETQVQ